jgi:hypothetical protein
MKISLYVSLISISLALLTSLTVYFKPLSNKYLNLFPIYLLIATILAGIICFLALRGRSNIILYNIFTILEFCFYFFVLSRIVVNKKMKRFIFFILLLYPFLAVFNTFLNHSVSVFQTRSYSLGCLLIVAFCVYYFYELFQLPYAIDLLREPAFWICSGLLFYFSCSFPLFGFLNSLKKPPQYIVVHLDIILNLLDVFLYSSFIIAFLCRIKIRKSM